MQQIIEIGTGLNEMNLGEVDAVSGGNVFNVIGAFRLGWDVGTYIDQNYIKGLWN